MQHNTRSSHTATRHALPCHRHATLEISQQAEIGIDDFFWLPSLRTIELALSGSSKNEAYSVKSRAKDLAKKSFSLSLSSRAHAFPPSSTRRRCGATPSLSNYDQDLWPSSIACARVLVDADVGVRSPALPTTEEHPGCFRRNLVSAGGPERRRPQLRSLACSLGVGGNFSLLVLLVGRLDCGHSFVSTVPLSVDPSALWTTY